MEPLLPIIPISRLQRGAKAALDGVTDYAVVRSHSRDVAFVLHPDLGRILLQSGMLDELRRRAQGNGGMAATEKEIEQLIGNVLRELSKK